MLNEPALPEFSKWGYPVERDFPSRVPVFYRIEDVKVALTQAQETIAQLTQERDQALHALASATAELASLQKYCDQSGL